MSSAVFHSAVQSTMASTNATTFLCVSNCFNQTLVLLTQLFGPQYSPNIIPSTNSQQPLVLSVLFALVKIVSLANSGVLNVEGLVILQWRDSRLQWDPEKFGKMNNLQVQATDIWTPTLYLLNPASNAVQFSINTSPLWVQSDGLSTGFIDAQMVTACDMDLTYFPYDTQNCYIKFTDISYFPTLLAYQPIVPDVRFDLYIKSKSWLVSEASVSNLSATTASSSDLKRNFSTLQIAFTLNRVTIYYTTFLIFPAILLEIMMLFVLLLPQGSVARVNLCASLLLSTYVLQKYSTTVLPSFTFEEAPRIVWGLCAGMVLGALVLLTSVVSVTIDQFNIPAPKFLKRLLLQSQTIKKSASETSAGTNGSPTIDETVFSTDRRFGSRRNPMTLEAKLTSKSLDTFDNDEMKAYLLQQLFSMQLKEQMERKKAARLKLEQSADALIWKKVEMTLVLVTTVVYIALMINFTIKYVLVRPP